MAHPDPELLRKAALLSGATVWQTRADAGVRALTLADGPHGLRKQLGAADHLGIAASQPATCFPTAANVASSWDVELAGEIGRALGVEAAAAGVDVLLGPGLNIKRSPLCGRNFEYFSEDPHLSGALAAAYVAGVQSCGVAACPKHFAANSQELRRMTSDSVVDERTLREIYLTGFEMVVRRSRPAAIMSAYNKINGTYAHQNAFLLTQVLREEWGFDGAVISDWGGSDDAVAAIGAGGTLEMPSPGLDSVRAIVAADEAGLVDRRALDARAAEMRALSDRTDPSRRESVSWNAVEHHELARRAAQGGVVLLRNENEILPLAGGTRVAVIGDFAETPRYQGAGSSLVNPTRVPSTLDAMAASGLTLTAYAKGFDRRGAADESLIADAITVAHDADVALVYLGLDELGEAEGRDRTDLRLPANQVALLEGLAGGGARIVVVLSAGGVLEMPWIEHCQAVVHGHLAGQAGAEALLDVITGVVCPSGKLAESYPVSLEDVPARRYYGLDAESAQYREGLFVGYRYYASTRTAVRFPFGFGLSYTAFSYDDLELSDAGASFTITNTGRVSGAEIAQLYVAPTFTGAVRPEIELRGFAKILLAPGESARVQIPFDELSFRHFSVATGRWETETGRYEIRIGASSADVRLRGELEVQGTLNPEPAEGLESYRRGAVTDVGDAEFGRLLGRAAPPLVPTVIRGAPVDLNTPLVDWSRARSPLARFVARVLAWQLARKDARGVTDLNLLFLRQMPPRAIAKMTNGMVGMPMAEAIVTVANGHLLRGLGQFLGAWSATIRASRRLGRRLGAVTGSHGSDTRGARTR